MVALVSCAAPSVGVTQQAAAPPPLPSSVVSTTTDPQAAPEATEPPGDPVFVVWSPDGLPADFAVRVAALPLVAAVTVIGVGNLHILETRDPEGGIVDRPPPGFVIPVEGLALDRESYRGFVSPAIQELIEALGPDQIILGMSSAELRRLDVGGRILFDGAGAKTVAAVVADDVFGMTEVVATGPPFTTAGSERQYALIRYRGSPERLEGALTALMAEGAVLRIRGPREGTGRQGRAVLPQLAIKEVFGEFAYRPTSRGRFQVDPEWREANIVSVDLPLLGRTQCHRVFAELLTEVMNALIAAGKQDAVDPGRFHGCWVARYIAGTARLSRHAFGAAADINFGGPLDGGPGSPVNPDLLEAMAIRGITSGHTWARPDPGHFEYFGSDPRDLLNESDAEEPAD